MALTDRHAKLIEARGLDVERLEMLGTESDHGQGDGDWISIPYFENGKRVNTKYRTISGQKQFRQDKDARKCFWNIDVISDPSLADQPLIITEGEFDAMAALQAGFARVVSVPDGAPPEAQGEDDSGAKYSYVRDAKALLRDVREIIIATDDDPAGVNLLNDLAIRFGRARCRFVRYPQGCKDINDALKLYGVAGVTASISRAQWMRVDGVYRMSELPPVPDLRPYEIGIVNLADHYNVRLGDLCIVTGIPSHGKSTFINEVCCRMVLRYGWSVAFASFEQKPQQDHRRNLRTFYNQRKVKDQNRDEIARADEWIDRHFSFIVPSEDDDVTLAWTLERAAASILQHNCRIVVIDPWNEMDHIRPPDMSLTEYTGFAIKQFRKLAHKYQVHVIVAAHPAKIRRDENGKTPIPTLYDISDSAHWFNKADVGIVVHRKEESRTILRIAKSRYHDSIGRPGDLLASFNPDAGRYVIIEDEAA